MAKLETSYDTTGDPKSPLGEIRALAYDVVLNGTELGSGSIRIHRQDIQSKIFRRARHDRRRGALRALDSFWKRWSTARLRMAALRWDSIAL